MKDIIKFINEAGFEGDGEYENIPVSFLYKELIKAAKIDDYSFAQDKEVAKSQHNKISDDTLSNDGCALLGSRMGLDDIKATWSKEKGWDYSKLIKALYDFFKDNWENTISGERYKCRETSRYFTRTYYRFTFTLGDHELKLLDDGVYGPLKGLSKYKV